MPLYRAKIVGRKKPVLIKADSGSAARDQLVELETLTAKEVNALFDTDEKPWKPGEELPADEE